MTMLWQDLRFALRQLRRSPGFAATALLTLACGIGLTAAMFNVAWRTLIAPLPYVQPQRLVALDFQFRNEKPSARQIGTAADFVKRYSHSYQSFGIADGSNTGINLADSGTASGHATPAQQLRISRDFLPTLGIEPVLGRGFSAEEDTHNGARAALLSYAAWQTQFASDPHILGRVLRIDEEDVPVVGVLPRGAVADLVGGTQQAAAAAVFQPLQLSPRDPGYEGTNYQMIARLKEGVSLAQAQAELDTLLPRFAAENPWYKTWSAPNGELNHMRVWPLHEALTGEVRSSLLTLLLAAAAVLLVACLNIAGLMVARTAARTRELAVRSALGAGRLALLRVVLAESLVLAAVGTALGILLARVAERLFLANAPIEIGQLQSPALWPLVMCASVLGLAATLLFGVLPAVVITARDINTSLRSAGSQGQSAAYQLTARGLIVGQVALAFVLLSAASLLLQSFLAMRSTAPGVATDHVTIGQVTLKGSAYASTAHSTQFVDRVVEELDHTPGVSSAAAVNGLPLDRGLNILGWPVGRKELRHITESRFVTPNYLQTMGITLLKGRMLKATDGVDAPPVTLINQAAASRWWPNGDAIGSRINIGSDREYEIVGIAADTHEHSLADHADVLAYIPLEQVSDNFTKIINNWFATTFVVRAATGVDVTAAMQRAVGHADAELPVRRIETMQRVVEESIATPRFFGWLSSGAASLTLLLAAVGLFSLLSYQVTQQTREIGIRMALGANRGNVLREMVARGLALAGAGLLAGVLLSLMLPRLLASAVTEFAMTNTASRALMHEVQSALAATLLMLLAAAAASLLPAARASRLEPVQALRSE